MNSTKRQKKGRISEEDMSNLLHRYPAQKVLSLLQEVSQAADAKMDWNALVQKTATGITNPREYQMLWRHIAYCNELNENVDDGAQPMDDDSDLEYELEAYPPISAEASAEAAACVKVLMGPGDSKIPNSSTVEAPLTINIPNGQSKFSSENSLPASMQGTNITVPVSVQKLPISQGSVQKQAVSTGATGDGADAANTSLAPRRKRKPWSEEEDRELMAAVKKCGEGNWANILKGDFTGERSASQLSQRWTIIRKRKNNQGGGNQSSGPQVSDMHVDTNRALQVALCDSMPTVGNGASALAKAVTLNTLNKDNAAVNNNPSKPLNPHFTPPGANPASSKPGTLSLPNPRPPLKKAPLKPLLNQDSSMVTKVAVAAGARIASPSEATLFKAAQANNAIHIMPKGGSTLMKSSVNSNANPTPSSTTTVGPNRTLPFGSPPVRPGLVRPTTAPPTPSVPVSHPTASSQPVRSTFKRPTVLPPPTVKASTSNTLPNSRSAPVSQTFPAPAAASRSNEVEVKKEEKPSLMIKVLPPPLPFTRPLPSQTIGAQPKPSPGMSSAGLVAPIQATAKAKENSQCSVKTEKEKDGTGINKVSAVVNAADRSSVNNMKDKNGSLAEGKRPEALSDKQSLPISNVVANGKSEAKNERTSQAEKLEQKEQK